MQSRSDFRKTLLALALAMPASAAAQSAADPAPATDLDRLLVTATRTAITADAALAAVEVIDREQIERSSAHSLPELLRGRAGITLVNQGGLGKLSTLFLRGTESDHTLFLVDGVRVGSPSSGLASLQDLPLEQIERIEIVRGPRAAFWGSDAIGGVIHVFTRDPSQPSVRVLAGSYGRAGASAGAGFGDDDRGLGVTAGFQRLDGFSATNPDSVFSYDPDRDGYRNRNLSLRGRTALGSQRLAFSALSTNADVQFDRGQTEARNASAGVTLGGDLRPGWSHQLTLGHAREDLDTASSFSNRFQSRRTSLDWLNSLQAGADATLSFGLNWQRENGASQNAFDGELFDQQRTSRAAFLAYGGRFGAHVLDLSVRHDDSDQYGAATSGNAAWGWDLSDRARVRLSWGEGFRAPNFNELFYPDSGYGFAGNPDLRPESSRTWEAGMEFEPAPGQRLGLSVYQSRVRDLIAFAAPTTNNAININRAELEGVELEYRFVRDGWTAGGNLAWQDAVDAGTGNALLRRAKRKAHVDLGYRFGSGLELGLDGDHVSARPDFGARLDAYSLVHLRLAWPIGDQWRVEGRLENLTDRDYAMVSGYNTPGCSGVLSVVWNGKR